MTNEPNKLFVLSDAALESNLSYYVGLSIEHQTKYMEYNEKVYLIQEELRLRECVRMNNGNQNQEG